MAVGLVALAAGVAVGLLLAGSLVRADHPVEGSADVGFARDMQTHHAQAVEMAVLVRDRSDDDELRQVALDIELTQQNQIGQMHGWLSVWGLPLAGTAEPMAWMADHGHGAGADDGEVTRMPGLATEEQMAALADAEGVEAERLFLELMIPHHRGGVDMARAALDRAEQPEVRRLAQAMVDAQTAEIVVLEALLAAR
ncbi:DUF305 domain-containing protein [Cellulomonas sp. APG4]|uniref:DUF305 domain-containing protein n=1 Tax=Cellulomonas sp. APG4 TaxID=1538656 RepID=UPI00351B9409